MARRSSAALAAAMIAGEIARPQPPRELTPAEADEWNSIVNRMPADWFTAENQPLLAVLCQQICINRMLVNQIHKLEEVDDRYERLVSLQIKTSKMIASISSQLRLTQRARYASKTAHRKIANQSSAAPRPWE